MAILFFSLRDVPADEAEDVRELLNANDIAYYETSAGNWGLSMPAIWLHHAEDEEKIRPLFAEYQLQRSITQRSLYLEQKQSGVFNNFVNHNLKQPLHFLIYCSGIALTIYVSVKWLIDLGL